MSAIICEDKNFLNNDQKQSFKKMICNESFPWYFAESTVMKQYIDNTPKVFFDERSMIDSSFFGHSVYSNMNAESHYFNDVLKLFNLFCETNQISYKTILRAKINLVPKSCHNEYFQQPAHVDYEFDHKVFLYYVDNSDGDTIIYKERYSGSPISSVNVLHTVSPEMGKGIIFDGNHFHSPTPPIQNNKRITVNIAFL